MITDKRLAHSVPQRGARAGPETGRVEHMK